MILDFQAPLAREAAGLVGWEGSAVYGSRNSAECLQGRVKEAARALEMRGSLLWGAARGPSPSPLANPALVSVYSGAFEGAHRRCRYGAWSQVAFLGLISCNAMVEQERMCFQFEVAWRFASVLMNDSGRPRS